MGRMTTGYPSGSRILPVSPLPGSHSPLCMYHYDLIDRPSIVHERVPCETGIVKVCTAGQVSTRTAASCDCHQCQQRSL